MLSCRVLISKLIRNTSYENLRILATSGVQFTSGQSVCGVVHESCLTQHHRHNTTLCFPIHRTDLVPVFTLLRWEQHKGGGGRTRMLLLRIRIWTFNLNYQLLPLVWRMLVWALRSWLECVPLWLVIHTQLTAEITECHPWQRKVRERCHLVSDFYNFIARPVHVFLSLTLLLIWGITWTRISFWEQYHCSSS